MSSPKWQIVGNEANKRFRTNAYRVLLTRARAGLIIFVPHGDNDDPTRSIEDMNNTYKALLISGCYSID